MFRLKSKASTSSRRPPQACGRIALSEIEKATNKFHESFLIREGSFGNVYKGKLSNGDVVAIKRMSSESSQGAKQFWVQAEMLFTLRHRNLVPIVGYYSSNEKNATSLSMLRPQNHEKEMILLSEYMHHGSLKELLRKRDYHVSFADRLNICIGAARGIHYLHTGTKTGIIHGNIRSSNIFFDKNGTAKISGFGLSKIGASEGSPSTVDIVPMAMLGYIDPDYYTCGLVTRKFDVYSFAVVMLEVLSRRPALDESLNEDQRSLASWFQNSIKKGTLKDIVDSDIRDEISPENLDVYFEIVKRCLQKNPDERPTMSELIASLEKLQKLLPVDVDISVGGNSTSPCPHVKNYTFTDLEKATKRFGEKLSIGEGSDADVFLGWVNRKTLAPSNHVFGIAVAVQRITSEIEIPVVNLEWPEDVSFLGQLVHPNIIKLLGCCIKDGYEHLLVYEHMKKSLSHFIHGGDPLPWLTQLNIMIGVAQAMNYMYTEKNVLCHFKSDDILLDEDLNAKLGSFGWAKHNPENVRSDDRIWLNGVFGYLKAASTGHVMKKNDIFCFGLVLLETITWRRLTDNDLKDLLKVLEHLEAHATNIKSKGKLLKKIMDPRLKDTYPIEDAFECIILGLKCVSKHHEDKPSREDILRSLKKIVVSNK